MGKALLSFIALAGIVCLASNALTQEPGQQGRPEGPRGRGNFLRMLPLMLAIDADQDGEISDKEIENSSTALKGLDKDKNGKLTEDELRPNVGGSRGGAGGPGGAGGARRGPGGGPPNSETFVNRAMEFDADKDGKLGKEELTKLAEQIGQQPFGGDRGNRGGGERRSQRPQRPESE